MALNLGRTRGDNPGSQDTILNSLKPEKTAIPRFTGKNADELNLLALFIEDKIASANEYGKKLTSKNVDTTLERMHTLMLKLKDASDSDDTSAYDKLQAEIIAQVKELMAASESDDKPKEVLLSDDDKGFIKELIAASTLTEATLKTEDLTGENGLTQDDINAALDKTITQQKVLNDDVVAAAEKANAITDEGGSSGDEVKAELEQMFKENAADDSLNDMSKNNATLFLKLQDLINGQVGLLNGLFGTFGDNFKNSPLFNYKNPFTSSVGKMPSVLDELSNTLNASAPKTVELGQTTLQSIFKGVHNVVLSVMKKTQKKKKKPPLPAVPIAGPAGPPPLSAKEKKEKKKASKIFDSLDKFMKRISDIIKNIVLHILDIISQIVIGICTAIAKGIGIIMRAIFANPYGMIILASLLLISIGILIISLAVKKLVDYVVDDLGPIIKEKLKQIDPRTLNNFIDKISKFVDVFTSILAGAFAPLIAIGTIIKNAIGPIGKVVAKLAEVLGKILVPLIQAIGEVIMILMKPILILLKMVALAIQKILMVMMPVIEAVLNLIVQIYKYVIAPLLQLVIAIVVPVLKIIGALIKGIIKIVKPILDLLMAIIMPAIEIIVAVVQGIIAIVKPIVEFLMVVIKAAIDIIVAAVQAIMAIVQPILDVIMGVIKIVVLGIQAAVKVILKIVGFVRKIIRKIFNAIAHPIKFVTSLVKGIGNWLAKFADFEIGFWKFKFKPLSFLKGLKSDDTGSGDDEDEEDEEDEDGGGEQQVDDKLKQQIEELNKKMDLQTKNLEDLLSRFNTTESIIRPMTMYAALRSTLNSRLLKNDVIPELEEIHDLVKHTGDVFILILLIKTKDKIKELSEKLDIQDENLNIIYNKTYDVHEKLTEMYDIQSLLSDKLNVIQDTVYSVSDKLDEQVQQIEEMIDNHFQDVMYEITDKLDALTEKLEELFGNNEMIDKLNELYDFCDSRFSKVLDKIYDVLDELSYSHRFRFRVSDIFANRGFRSVLNFVSDAKKKAATIAKKPKKSIFDAISSIKKKITSKVSEKASWFSKFKDSAKTSFFDRFIKPKAKETTTEKTKSSTSIFDKIKNKIAEKAKSSTSIFDKIKNIISDKMKTAVNVTKSVVDKVKVIAEPKAEATKAEQAIEPPKTDVQISALSVQQQFKSILSVNTSSSSNMKNVSEELEEIRAEEASTRKDKDISNIDLKNFLTTMFENIDESFFLINKKLDEPNLMPMPMSMNINNLALLGAN